MTRARLLVVEDGHEYIETFSRFLGEDFEWVRVGDGQACLDALSASHWDLIFLDMRFDRSERLIGDQAELEKRFHGDAGRAKKYLENHQGTYIAHAIRDAGYKHPLLFSYDFDGEPQRFAHLAARLAPMAYVNDMAGPADIRTAILRMLGG
jgi:CheY-like chemotaxis protein